MKNIDAKAIFLQRIKHYEDYRGDGKDIEEYFKAMETAVRALSVSPEAIIEEIYARAVTPDFIAVDEVVEIIREHFGGTADGQAETFQHSDE